MTTLTLLARAYNTNQLNRIGDALTLSLEGLDVTVKILGAVSGKWVQIDLAGEDETIAKNYITKEMGLCPINLESIMKDSALKGYIADFRKNKEELLVDVGVFQPKSIPAVISTRYLQGQLLAGRKVALEKIDALFGFCDGLPLGIKIVRLNQEQSLMEAELSAWQVEKYEVWNRSLLDRLIVLGASLPEVKSVLEYSELNRDVIGLESLGMCEHALVCKLGTDAAGLIPRIGRILKTAKFAVFNPRRIMRFLSG